MSTQNIQLEQYRGRKTLEEISIYSIFVLKCDNELTAIFQQNLSNKQLIYFIPDNVDNATEYRNEVSIYILCIYSTLINRQKARIDITDIKPFFDILVPNNEPLSIFKPRLVKIISGAEKIDKSKFGMKDINNMNFKRAHKKKLSLSERTILNNYHCVSNTNLPDYLYSFSISVENYQSLEDNKSNNLIIFKVFLYDRTFVLIWDIETYSGHKMEDLPNARNEEDQELMVKHNVVNDYQEVSSIAYVSLSDAHYFAGGMKVCNLLGAEAWSSNMLCSMIASENTEYSKYPGAYVITLIKSLENKCLVTGLDFASLYPSLIMTYNLSPDKIILSYKEMINVIRSRKKIYIIKFLFNSQTIEAWFIHHNNISEEKDLYARVLENLFNKRKKIKKCLNELNKESFEYSCLDSKQKAVKLYMNTFYGKADNNLSSFYQLQLAGGVTSARQRNIKFVKKFVEDKEFSIKYRDTDSLYFTCPEECFQKSNLCNEVNTKLEKENGMPYLNIAYEKLLFPVVFTGKKKYYGLEHKNKPNFNLGKLFIREVNIVKRGQSKLFCNENVKKLSKLDYDEFIQTCIWRPKKESKQRNISVEQFVSQMEAKYSHKVLKNQQLIKKVVSKEIYDNCREKISQQKGDCMEYPDVKNATTQAEKICSGISGASITRSSGVSAEHNNYFNILDKITDSTRSKLLNLLSKLSKLNVGYRNAMYDLITQVQKRKPKITILEQYIFLYDLESECRELIDFWNTWYKVVGLEITRLQALSITYGSKKDDPSDIDDTIDLYCKYS
ncbi:2623_t:CDS:2 [Cetraspora pellucida]|uniref:2623_t:CDS:1 n=1 Tax=Cetraspora pellucida TaxID=1433469 RepID=A0ACA9KLX6_9GLOM|nr:2623_t:CDS:2 [Cetraspora pellucida]